MGADEERSSRYLLGELASSDLLALHRWARTLTTHSSDAWDLVQDAFERALRRAPPALEADELRRWLVSALRNLVIDRHRRAGTRRHVPLAEAMALVPALDAQEPFSRWRMVDDQALHRAVAALEPRLREVYLLHAEHRLSLGEIARRLAIPVATAGTRIFRARRRLQMELTRGVSHEPASFGVEAPVGALTRRRSRVVRSRSEAGEYAADAR